MDPTLQYLLLIFGGCLGIYQIAAAAGNFKGLWFLRKPLPTCILGCVILITTYVWFFTWGDVKMNSDANNPEVEGGQQLGLFLVGAFLALVTTFLISSLVNIRGIKTDKESVIGEGIEDLKGRTVFRAFAYRWKNRKRGK
ncbi:MAG: hypothetical protein HQ553_06135 [Chloroflexi bacterium]|nr:hypothetical protein [Chloroflexota bacterium]